MGVGTVAGQGCVKFVSSRPKNKISQAYQFARYLFKVLVGKDGQDVTGKSGAGPVVVASNPRLLCGMAQKATLLPLAPLRSYNFV